MEFGLLGLLEVKNGGETISIGRGRESALLAILLLRANEPVSSDQLIHALWGERAPENAAKSVQQYVSRLRRRLGADRLATTPGGYVLQVEPGELDCDGFEAVARRGRQELADGDSESADRLFAEALGLWRGPALADFRYEEFAQEGIRRLESERRRVRSDAVDAQLALGREDHVLPELHQLIDENPHWERPRAQLMLALYRSGQQSDALEVYRNTRALFDSELGLEPSRELQELERAILVHDTSLDAPARPDRAPSSRRSGMALLVAGACVLAAGAVAAIAVTVGRSSSAHSVARVDADSAGAIDPGSNRLVSDVRVGAGPGRIATGLGSVWVVNEFDNTVSRINPATGAVEDTIQVDPEPTGIAVSSRSIWVACAGTRSLDRIDPRAQKVVQRVRVGNGPSAVAVSPGAIWVTNRLDDTVTEIDPTTGTRRRTLPAGSSPSDVAYGFGALWIANEVSSTVTRLDLDTGALEEVAVGNGPAAVAAGDGSVWVANELDGTVWRIDPTQNTVSAAVPAGAGPSSIVTASGAVWVADRYGGRVIRIDPATNRQVSNLSVGSGPQALASLGGRVWLSARQTSVTHRGGTLRMYDLLVPDSLDQGRAFLIQAWSVLATTADGLVGYRRVGGLDGGTIVPDLATSIPRATNSGRTYTFHLRGGITYSTGTPVRASDFRRGIERAFRLRNVNTPYYTGIVGAAACSKAQCDLSRGIVTDDRVGTITFHLRAPDPEFLYKIALPAAYPVPPSVPMAKVLPLGVPGTGPYMIRSYKRRHLVLVRNPRFHEWSAAAQPDGYPDRIEWTFTGNLGVELTAVENGRADLMVAPPASRQDEIETRYASQVHSLPATEVFGIFFNTRVPPFDNLDARRAVNLAIDRSKAVISSFGGGVTCQILPPGMPGYRPYCPYTKNRTGGGVWTGPDLSRARKLIAASGTKGSKVTLWTIAEPPTLAIARVAVPTLRALGYRVGLRILPLDAYWQHVNNSRTRTQIGFIGWQQDYPAPSEFFTHFTCGAFHPGTPQNSNQSGTCDQRIDRVYNQALASQADESTANANWAALDRLVTNLSSWAPLYNPRNVVFVSRRLGNLQSNPEWGILIDQLWVR